MLAPLSRLSSLVFGQVPLVQAIYDELKTMRDPIAHAQAGEDSPVISKARKK